MGNGKLSMTASTTNQPEVNGEKTLDEVRREIDSIDDAMHDLLMRRADLAAEVAAAKARDAQAQGA
ncbi:MAG: chorismate mutase, partial [Parvibaculaceae bacterium]|nr:chorismate mutase [Parvibaculaceae bacterium]